MMALLLSGCPDPDRVADPDPMDLPYQGVSVGFALPSGPELAELWAPAVNDWADENDAAVQLIEIDWTEDRTMWLPQLMEDSVSLVLLPTVLVNELIAADMVAAIPEMTLDDDVIAWSQVPPSVRTTLGTVGNAPSIVPVTAPTPVLCYRADLLEAAGKSPPATWEEYDQLVSDIEHWAPGLVAVEPRSDASLPTLFFARALGGAKHPAQYSVELDTTTGDPLMASAPFITALEELQAVSPQLAPDVRTMTPSDCLQALAGGEAAIGILWESSESRESTGSSDDLTEKTRGPLGFVPLPGRSTVYDRDTQQWVVPPTGDRNRPALCGFGGWSVCVLNSASPTEQSAAWDFWGLLESYQADGTIASLSGNRVTAEAALVKLSAALSPGENQEYGRAVTENLRNVSLSCELPVCGREALWESLQRVIARALDDETSAEAALQQVQEVWTETIDATGRQKVLYCYRQRLGLTALAE